MVKRLITEQYKQLLKKQNKFKNIKKSDLTDKDIRELIILIAERLNIL